MTRILGIGTGRSGTESLSRLLDGCDGATVYHEEGPFLPWTPTDASHKRARRYIEQLPQHTEAEKYAGEVAACWLPYVPMLRREFPKLKVFAILRDIKPTVVSFLGHMPDACTSDRTLGHQQFPTYNLPNAEALRRYCKAYHAAVKEWCIDYVPLEAINRAEGQRRVFDLAGIDIEDRVHEKHHVR